MKVPWQKHHAALCAAMLKPSTDITHSGAKMNTRTRLNLFLVAEQQQSNIVAQSTVDLWMHLMAAG